MPFYAVVAGRNPGIYTNWDDCKEQIVKYRGAWFKKFKTEYEANKCMKSKEVVRPNTYTIRQDDGPPEISSIQIKVYDIRRKVRKCIEHFAKKIEVINERLDNVENEINTAIFGDVFDRNICPDWQSDKTCGAHENFNSWTSSDAPTLKYLPYNQLTPTNSSEDAERGLAHLNIAYRGWVPSSDTNPNSSPHQSQAVKPTYTNNWEQPLDKNSVYVPPLIEDKNGFIDVYIDGAVTRNGKDNAVGGVGVWFNHGHPLNIAAALEGPATNVNAEIQAATRAIQQAAAAGLTKLNIHTDSMFMINCITKWIKSWRKNGWKTTFGTSVKNRVELEKLEEAIKNMEEIKWTHTRSHQGNEGNENADTLAHTGVTLNGLKQFNDYHHPDDFKQLRNL